MPSASPFLAYVQRRLTCTGTTVSCSCLKLEEFDALFAFVDNVKKSPFFCCNLPSQLCCPSGAWIKCAHQYSWRIFQISQDSAVSWSADLHRCRLWNRQNYLDFYDHRRSTVILRKWIGIDRRYRPYSPIGKSLSTVDIDRDRSTSSINRWIGIDI